MENPAELHPICRDLIESSKKSGHFDDSAFTAAQCKLPPEQRDVVRYSPEIARLFFGIQAPDQRDADYYFWDTTTLAFKQPLLEFVRDNSRVLEIGPGAAATLSIFIHKNKKNLISHGADINPRFLQSAKKSAQINGVDLKLVHSDMTQNVREKYDVVFMNPPYVKTIGLQELGIDPNSPEGMAGFGGEDGTLVVRKFLKEVPAILNPGGTALLGINTRHLEDEVVERLIAESGFKLTKKYYSPEQAQPRGPFSQVYVLALR